MQFGGEGVYWSVEEVLDEAVRRKQNGRKQGKWRRKRLAGWSDGKVGNASERGLGPNGDTGGTGRWGSSFGGVPNDDIENTHQSTSGEKA